LHLQSNNTVGFVNRFLIRLFLVAMLLCGFFGSRIGVKAQSIVDNAQKSEEQIKQSDGWLRQVAEEPQSPVESTLRTAPSSHRVASSRPTRLLPTRGGRTGQHHGRGGSDGLLNPYRYLPCWQCYGLVSLQKVYSSPRLYYVIALRRLLC